MNWLRQVKTGIFFTALTGALTVAAFGPARAAEGLPTGEQVLRLVRASESDQHRDLTGRLRMSTDSGKVVAPFQLHMRGATITYEFSNPPEALVLRLGEKGSRLEKISGSGKTQVVSGAKLDAPVRGTDVTYEDLAMKFLYWRNARVAGEESVMTRTCWLVQAQPTTREDSQYDMVRLWVEKSGGLLKAECYSHGKLVKRFHVRSVQHDTRGGYMLKTLRIERPDKDEPTYLEIDSA